MKTLKILQVFLQLKWQETFGQIQIPWKDMLNFNLKVGKTTSIIALVVSVIAVTGIPICYGVGKLALLIPNLWVDHAGETFNSVVTAGFISLILLALSCVATGLGGFIVWQALKIIYDVAKELISWLGDNWKKATEIVERRSVKG